MKSKVAKKLQLNDYIEESERSESELDEVKPIMKPAAAPTRQLPGRKARTTAEQALKNQLGEETARDLMEEEMEESSILRKRLAPKLEKTHTIPIVPVESPKKVTSTPVKINSSNSTPKIKDSKKNEDQSFDLYDALVEDDHKESVIELVNKKKKVNPHAKMPTKNKLESPRARSVSGPPLSPPTRSRSLRNK